MKVELRERSFGELVGQTYSLAAAYFVKLFLIGVILGLPGLVFQLLAGAAGQGPHAAADFNPVATFAGLAALLVSIIVVPIEQGVCTLLVASSFTGDNPSLGDCFRLAFRRLGSMLALSMVFGLSVGFGFLLLVIPGLMFLTWYYVAASALLVERIPYRQAMERSKQLSEGNRLSILGFILVTLFVIILIEVSVAAISGRLLGVGAIATVVNYFVTAAVGTVGIVAPVVYYFNLRVKKEAFDIKALSALVDAIAERGTAGRGAAET